ncbi:putative N-acetyltransferase, GNAT family [Periconia macrospinosa]|uniref:Putative N-acetyltransferase, GNAT family n=1 Tax=Periconia macrospinosa TaxID=97972 RepID=A0A2V1E0Z1_9PLEO|nr:putative N-acetyltransferase, GNAT family [Periconia macrospinosa]
MSTNSPLQFRKATPSDTPQVQSLIEAAFQADDTRPNWTAAVELNRSFRLPTAVVESLINSPDSAFLIATSSADGSLVGVVGVTKRSPDLGRILHLAIDQKYQRGGLGRHILAYAEQYCRDTWGVGRIGLDALCTRVELIKWYERRGYVRTGETSPFPAERVKELVLPEGLHFVELEKGV